MSIPDYTGSVGFNTSTVPSTLSGDWSGYISCRTDSQQSYVNSNNFIIKFKP